MFRKKFQKIQVHIGYLYICVLNRSEFDYLRSYLASCSKVLIYRSKAIKISSNYCVYFVYTVELLFVSFIPSNS